MQKVTLGRSGLVVPRNGFGALPIQRIPMEDAVRLIRRALDGGMYYFDTARFYTDSEEKLGVALEGRRNEVIISTKTGATTADAFWRDLETSLRLLRTDYVDLYQFHNLAFCPKPGDGSGLYEAMLEAKKQGKIRHIGITAHKIGVAEECIASGLFETLQFPFSYISSDRDLALAEKCKEAGMGYIAMKGLAGGMLTNVRACHAFMKQYDNVVPIWGIQHMEELRQWLRVAEEDPDMDEELAAFIKQERQELSGSFCRSCGYCMPCPMGIEIRNCARMNMLLRRSPWQPYMSPEWQAKMNKIEDCIGCRRCSSRCPYQLDTPNLLKYMLKDYREFYEAHKDQL